MDRLSQRLQTAQRAITTLDEVVGKPDVTAIERDAAIQRFEFSYEATWKAMRHFLQEQEGIQVGSPKATIRATYQIALLDESQSRLALQMTDDRNLTVHTYNETVAVHIYAQLVAYRDLMQTCVTRMLDALQD